MKWLVFVHGLRSGPHSRARTAVWRKIRQLGAVALPGGAQLLPDRAACRDALYALVETVRADGGDAAVLSIDAVEGQNDETLIACFQRERAAAYAPLAEDVTALETRTERSGRISARRAIAGIERRLQTLAPADYFDAPERLRISDRLRVLARQLDAADPGKSALAKYAVPDYRGRRWVAATRPSIDALACVWLIRRHIDPGAIVRYADRPQANEVAIDLARGEFSHHGAMCAFERMVFAFRLETPALTKLGQIVHDLVMTDTALRHAESAGIAATLRGWRLGSQLSDAELEARTRALFDGVAAAFQVEPGL